MRYFRDEVRKAGFPGLHLQFTLPYCYVPTEKKLAEFKEDNVIFGGISSLACYNMGGFNCDYLTHCENAVRIREEADAAFDIPVFPTMSVGWDEWVEGSYLLPDALNGYGFLEAVKDVFGR